MSPQPEPVESGGPRADGWAEPVDKLKVSGLPPGAVAVNLQGRRVTSPLQGFGPMWQKTYRVRLSGIGASPTEVIKAWKANFPTFWPRGNRFYAPLTGIAPGEVAVLRVSAGGMPLSTGVLVMYADDESFTLMTPEGHMFAGWITFSAFDEDGSTVAQAQVLMRASDPIYELGLRLGAHSAEDRFWQHTLRALAAHFGVNGQVQTQAECVDPRIQWRYARNIWHNAGVGTALYITLAPVRWIGRLVRR